MVSDALKALLSDEAQEIGYLVAARSQASMGNRESSGRRIADGCDCDKPSVGEEAQGQATSSATDSPIERQAAKARSHLEAQMPLSLGHGKHGEGGVEEEDDWPEGGGENRQEGEEEGVGKTQVLVTPLLQDVLPGFSLSLSLSHTCIHTHCLSHTRTRMAGVRTHTCQIGLIKNGVPKVLNFATTHSDALRFQVYICVCKCLCVNVHVHIDIITALIYTCKLYMRTLSPRPPLPASALPLSLAPRHDSKRLTPFFGSSRDPKTGACRVPGPAFLSILRHACAGVAGVDIPTRTCVQARAHTTYINTCTCSHKIIYTYIFAQHSMQEKALAISEAGNQMAWMAEEEEEDVAQRPVG